MTKERIILALEESENQEVFGEHSGEFGCFRPAQLIFSANNAFEAYLEIERFLALLERSRVAFPGPENQPSQVVDS